MADPSTAGPSATVAIPPSVLDELEGADIALAPILDRVEELLAEQVRSSAAFVDTTAGYLVEAGGKRFRPMLVALTAHLGDPGAAEIVPAGVIVELVHLATLYHDDVIDEAPARRGVPSANARWDNTVAILTGDFLFARAAELSANLGVEVTRIMGRTLAELCEGQIAEVQGSAGALPPDVPRVDPTVDHYLDVIAGKTSSLVATSCRYGALLSGCAPEVVELAASYGRHVGMAFQLSDDILDVASDHEDSGKTPGTDLLEGVRTLPVAYALEDDPTGRFAQLVGDGAVDPADLDEALGLLRGSDAIERARVSAASYVEAAEVDLEAIDAMVGPDREAVLAAMGLVASYSLERVG
ncbi:polyprenyl synthetase family protein [Salsipaludibacter albus]|uniref:polyprenyl synthetase family protein n=1 Tax=Salsipaludibacter albus TaxID=2849650 RepID=UPI001EE494F2